MINTPYNANVMSQIMPCQNVPVQTSQNNFQSFQQPQTAGQQMQTSPCATYAGNPQGFPTDPYNQPGFYQFYHPHTFNVNNPRTSNVLPTRDTCQPIFQAPCNAPPTAQAQPAYGPLPPNILEQIRACVSSAAPIFILPSGCHQSANHQQATTVSAGASSSTGQPGAFNYPTAPSICCPPSFYPYPIPMPIYEPYAAQIRAREKIPDCLCCQKSVQRTDLKNRERLNCCYDVETAEHHCGETTDDTICSRRNCPSSISLQALASQFLSIQGVVSCTATRLVLRKIPGSNVTTTMEETMDRAQKSISALTKEQLLAESRNAQQVSALITLHMTTNLPPNVVPALTLLQLKVNVLKAQIENLINKKLMECQGYGMEVETSDPIDPSFLAQKGDGELREFLTVLRQRECDERVNANFSPYHSQRVMAESRLSNVQSKLRQVEGELERRRHPISTSPTITSRIIRQFSESYCSYGLPQCRLFDGPPQSFDSPDPFEMRSRNPRRLNLKPHVGSPETTYERTRGTCATEDVSTQSASKDNEDDAERPKKDETSRRSSAVNCTCGERTSSEESLEEDKKKLQLRIDEDGNVTMTSRVCMQELSLLKLARNVVAIVDKNAACDKARVKGDVNASEMHRASMYIDIAPDVEPTKLIEIPPSTSAESGIKESYASASDGLRSEETEPMRIVETGSTGSSMKSIDEGLKGSASKIAENTGSKIDEEGKIESATSERSHESAPERKPLKAASNEDPKSQPSKYRVPISPKLTDDVEPHRTEVKRENDGDVDHTEKLHVRASREEATEAKRLENVTTAVPRDTSLRAVESKNEHFAAKDIKSEPESPDDTALSQGLDQGQTNKIEGLATEAKADQDASTYTSSFQIALRPSKRRQRGKRNVDTACNDATSDVDGSHEKEGIPREHVVSMMTNISYDWQCADYGKRSTVNDTGVMRLKSTMNDFTKNRRSHGGVSDFLKTISEESVLEENNALARMLSRQADPSSLLTPEQNERKRGVNISDETCDGVRDNASLKRKSRGGFARDRSAFSRKCAGEDLDTEETANEVRSFPIRYLNVTRSACAGRTDGKTKKGLFDRSEIVSNSPGIDSCNMEIEKSFISQIYSVIASNLTFIRSFMKALKKMYDKLYDVCYNALSNAVVDSIPEKSIVARKVLNYLRVNETSMKNKEHEGRTSDWRVDGGKFIDVPSIARSISKSKNKNVFDENSLRYYTTKKCNKIHDISRSIVSGRLNINVRLLEVPVANQERGVSMHISKRSFRSCRSVLIRSRSKDLESIREKYVHSFTFSKRRTKNTKHASQRRKTSAVSRDVMHTLKRSKKFWSLPK